ncbi:EamA family transporter, partial [Mesorhizobium sp. M2D.F.Ca.ET.145.01.1.1]
AAGVAEPSLRILAACVLVTGGAALAAKSLFLRKSIAIESGAGASEDGARASEDGARVSEGGARASEDGARA